MSALKPCPFCGKQAADVERGGDPRYVMVWCKCSARGPIAYERDEVIRKWNTRADEARVRREVLEEVKAFVPCTCGLQFEARSYDDHGSYCAHYGIGRLAAKET